jgi:hypothetical protein
MSSKFRQECESEVDVLEPVSFDEAADPDRLPCRLQFDKVVSKAVPRVADERHALDVAAGVVEGAHVTIADVLQKQRVVEQFDDEGRVVDGQLPDPKPRCVNDRALVAHRVRTILSSATEFAQHAGDTFVRAIETSFIVEPCDELRTFVIVYAIGVLLE